MARILLVDADSHNGFPNLSIMKLSAYHKSLGDHVDLIKGIPSTAPLEQPDKAYISCIFFQNTKRVKDYAAQFSCPVELGGSGVDLKKELSYEIEHIRPDYSLYDLDYSLGFTSRGCIRKCGFCVVPEKEGMIRDNAPISEFLHPDHKKVILLDNNFQASPRWKENIVFLVERDLKVNFNQGLDIRLVNEEFARRLADTNYYNWTFKHRGLHFAFDSMGVEKAVVQGIDVLTNAGIRASHLMFYVLVGYDTTFDEDLYRVNILRDLGVKPYIQLYNQTKDRELRRLARWINRKYYEFLPFEGFMGGLAPAYDHSVISEKLQSDTSKEVN